MDTDASPLQVPNLSGGELQRVALTLCLGKPADVYLIDEPSAYLDSEQRLMAARVIKRFRLCPRSTSALLLLSLLDSLSCHFVFAGTSSTRRRRHLWWNTTSSWRPIWPTESLCSTAFPPRRPLPTRKSQENHGVALFEHCRHGDHRVSLLPQASESAGRDEPLPVAA